jgi:hypothetical protein
MASGGVRAIGQHPNLGVTGARDPLCPGAQLSRLRMLERSVAEQDRLALAREQRSGDGLRDRSDGNTSRRRRFATPLGDRRGDLSERAPMRRVARSLCAVFIEVVVRGMQHRQLRAPLGRIAQARREQRLVLAQEGPISSTRSSALTSAIGIPSQGAPSSLSPAKSLWRSR